jgi:hypothetical protein
MKLLLFAAVFVALPLVLFRGRGLRRYFACDAALWSIFAALAAVTQAFHIDVDPYPAFVAFAVVKLALVSLFLAGSDPRDLHWSANRAGLAAMLVYLLVIPAMTRSVVDGDEPFYLLQTESLVRDHDLDLRNQYANLAHSETRRLDLKPQLGDPLGRHGDQRSHLEPLLSFLMIPGYMLAGLYGALATIALFAAMLARATVRLFEDEGIDDSTTRSLFPLIAFGPPIIFYAARIWPEVPGAWMFVEAVRGIRQHRSPRWMAALLALVLLKLRFLLIAAVLLVRAMRTRAHAAIAVVIFALPLAVFYSTSAHSIRELIPGDAIMWLQGLFGLVVDGQAGIAFQAPLYLGGLLALSRWPSMPPGFRLGMSASLLYVFTLVPRPEWHGGWSPPLRYIVVFMPVLALGCAAIWDRWKHAIAPIALWTILLVVHGLAFPWALFHIADGQNFIGEWMSDTWVSDFSRMLPSFVRPNLAAVWASIAFVALLVATAVMAHAPTKPSVEPSPLRRAALPVILALAIAVWFSAGRRPGDRLEFEDVVVDHTGGELFPNAYTVSRFVYRGGWIVHAGDLLRFPARRGPSIIEYQAARPAVLEIGGRAYAFPATGAAYGRERIELKGTGITTLHCLSGDVNLDRMDHE